MPRLADRTRLGPAVREAVQVQARATVVGVALAIAVTVPAIGFLAVAGLSILFAIPVVLLGAVVFGGIARHSLPASAAVAGAVGFVFLMIYFGGAVGAL